MRWFTIIVVGSAAAGLSSVAGFEAPQTDTGSTTASDESDVDHWSFHRPIRPQVPVFDSPADCRWLRNSVDAFILAKLKENGLRPASETDRRTLIRRLTFDLTGLPPTPDEIEAFQNDPSPLAHERLVDRLLASPNYGARWGQHWLDVVRFAETEGFEYDRHHAHAWRYRDYVIRSLNDDKAYDRFVTEQLAGDELALSAPVDNTQTNHELWIAAGFHRLGPVRRNAGNAEVAFSRNEVLTERTNIVGSAFLGLTIGCARCHDHMFDPIPQADYYRLQAFMAATYEYDVPLADEKTRTAWKTRNEQIDAEIARVKKALADATTDRQQKLNDELKVLEVSRPKPLPRIFSIRNISEKRTAIHLLERGDETKKRERVHRRPPGIFLTEQTAQLSADSNQPKTELARWITSPGNPLTARVMVNRIWQYHFDGGLIETPNDFGLNGRLPSHPQLLDYLAVEFINSGWSLKSMHRLILLSSAYRQSTRSPLAQQARAKDPGNRLLWHFSRRRLQAEEIRDAMLTVAGILNVKAGGPSVMVPVDQELISLLYKPTQWQVTPDASEHNRRSIYLIAKRNLRLPFLEVFDQPDLQTSCSGRVSSTHAPQALEMLNGSLSNALAAAFAKRLEREAGQHPADQVDLAYVLTTGRRPSARQQRLAIEFVKASPLKEFALAMFNLNAFFYVD